MRRRFARRVAVTLLLLLSACEGGHRVEMLQESRPASGLPFLVVRASLPAGKMEVSRGDSRDLYGLKLSYCRKHSRARSVFAPRGKTLEAAEGGLLTIALDPTRETVAEGRGSQEPNWLSLNLRPLLPLQREDFVGIFKAMDGLPVTVRLLDPPLHEFLPDLTALSVTRLSVHGGAGPTRIRFSAGNPRDLRLFRFVAGSGPVDLKGLGWGRVTSLEYHGGAGRSSLDWGGPGPDESAAFLDPGTGRLDLSFPADLGVSLAGGWVPPDPQPEGFRRRGEGWVSANWETASRHLTLVLEPGLAPVHFAWNP